MNLEVSEEMSNHHPKRKIPNWNEEVLRHHKIDNELGDVYSNVFQKKHNPYRDCIHLIWEGCCGK